MVISYAKIMNKENKHMSEIENMKKSSNIMFRNVAQISQIQLYIVKSTEFFVVPWQ